MKRWPALILLIALLFCGCREGGYDRTSGYVSEKSFEEFNVGERSVSSAVSSSTASSYSSSTVSSGSAQRSSSEPESSSSVSSIASSTVSSSISSSVSTSTRSEAPSGTSCSSSSADTVPVIVEVVPGSSESTGSSEPTVVPEEPVPDQTIGGDFTIDNTSSDSGNAGDSDDVLPGNGDIFADPSASSPSVSSVSASSSETAEPEPEPEPDPEPEPEPETPVSPYDYEGTVYVAASGNGTKYHLNPKCSNMKGTVEMDVPEALEKGFTPCKKCWEL